MSIAGYGADDGIFSSLVVRLDSFWRLGDPNRCLRWPFRDCDMGRHSATGTPTPRGNTLDGQLRLSFRQVLRNGAMGIDQCAFVGSHFTVSSATVRNSFKKMMPGGGALDEDTFLEIMAHAMAQNHTNFADRPRLVNKNSSMLHKEFALDPLTKIPIVLHLQMRNNAKSSESAAMPHLPFDQLSPANKHRAKIPPPLMRLNRSEDRGCRASTPMMSPDRSQERSHSVPPMTPRALESSIDDFQRPGSAIYMKPYASRHSDLLPTWKWYQVDNNVPKNIRNVLLRPMKMSSRPATPSIQSPEMHAVLDRMKAALRGITRMEAIQALTQSQNFSKNHLVSVKDAKNALQMLGLNLSEEETLLLAQETRALSEDGKVQPIVLTTAIIPVAGNLNIADVGIEPEKFAKFKAQRLSFTRALSKTEMKLLKHLRDKLSETCHGGPAELRKSFKLVDENGTGRCDCKQMVLALELQGLGMSRTDAGVLYSILAPDQRGMDYNEFTAAMMPPELAETRSQTVSLGFNRGDSKSRQGLRDRQNGASEKSAKKVKPDPDEVQRFMERMTPENVIQVLKNRVALALKAGPGAIRKWFSLFDKDGNNEIDTAELKDLMVDFGLNLSSHQVAELMDKIDGNKNGLLDQGELIAALLPVDQVCTDVCGCTCVRENVSRQLFLSI